MRKSLAISFLFIFLFSSTELNQLLKLPVMIHHYLEHHENISFLDFINEHYAINNSAENTDSEHQKLPFKSHNCGVFLSSFACPVANRLSFKSETPTSQKENISYKENFYSSSSSSKIWQPPKFC